MAARQSKHVAVTSSTWQASQNADSVISIQPACLPYFDGKNKAMCLNPDVFGAYVEVGVTGLTASHKVRRDGSMVATL